MHKRSLHVDGDQVGPPQIRRAEVGSGQVQALEDRLVTVGTTQVPLFYISLGHGLFGQVYRGRGRAGPQRAPYNAYNPTPGAPLLAARRRAMSQSGPGAAAMGPDLAAGAGGAGTVGPAAAGGPSRSADGVPDCQCLCVGHGRRAVGAAGGTGGGKGHPPPVPAAPAGRLGRGHGTPRPAEGHTCLAPEVLIRRAARLVEVEAAHVRTQLAHCLAHGDLVAPHPDRIYAPAVWTQEQQLGAWLCAAVRRPAALPAPDRRWGRALARLEVSQGQTWNPQQRAAVQRVFAHRFSVLTGGAGTGKTTVLRAIWDLCGVLGLI